MAPPRPPEAMLATRTDRRFSDPAWVYERKLDGYRVLATCVAGEVRLWSRAGNPLSWMPEVVDALAPTAAEADLVLDGEVVAYDPTGRTSFSRLQTRVGSADARAVAHTPLTYVVFDLLEYDDHDLRGLPLLDRKTLLRDAVRLDDTVTYADHVVGEGEAAYAEACAAGWEGLIAKRAASAYRPGRGRDWLKLKCVVGQELVIGGWTEPQGSRAGLGALLVGYHDASGLRYAGKVGTGFDARTLTSLRAALDPLERDECPFGERLREPRVHWVEPVLVAQVQFAEWTDTGRVRHSRFVGLRDDVDPAAVVREP